MKRIPTLIKFDQEDRDWIDAFVKEDSNDFSDRSDFIRRASKSQIEHAKEFSNGR